MTTDEVLAAFPGSKDDPEVRSFVSRPPSNFGVSQLVIRPEKYQTKDNSKPEGGVTQITASLLDGRVSTLNFGYNGPEWPHVDKFIEKLVGETNLPEVAQWEAYAGQDNQLKTLTCADFSIRVFAGGQGGNLNYVLLQDLNADKTLKERRKKAREQASP